MENKISIINNIKEYNNQRISRVTILLSEKVCFRAKTTTTDKEDHFIITKVSIY